MQRLSLDSFKSPGHNILTIVTALGTPCAHNFSKEGPDVSVGGTVNSTVQAVRSAARNMCCPSPVIGLSVAAITSGSDSCTADIGITAGNYDNHNHLDEAQLYMSVGLCVIWTQVPHV